MSGAAAGTILLTNDDGIRAAGLRALAAAFAERYGDRLLIVAPEAERSAVGHGITMRGPLRVGRYTGFGPAVPAYAVAGTPVDCVKLAVCELATTDIALVCAGVNHGANLGTDVFYSGTVSAAREAAIMDIPAIAVSAVPSGPSGFRLAAATAVRLATAALDRRLPPRTLLNVNVPPWAGPDDDRAAAAGEDASPTPEIRVTRLGFSRYADSYQTARPASADGEGYYLLSTERPAERDDAAGTDIGAIRRGQISITPVQLDPTDHATLAKADIARWLL